jgi:hypothetical protein
MHSAFRQLAEQSGESRPHKDREWGQQSWDEMMVGFFNLVYDPRIYPKGLLPEKKVVANSKASIADH